MTYRKFIDSKTSTYLKAGFDPALHLFPPAMKPHQIDVTAWACRRGRAALFLDTGLGKTLCQLVWADQVVAQTSGKVLILAPLAVSAQTQREGDRFDISTTVVSHQSNINGPGIYVTNYEKLHHFDAGAFTAVVLDESSILKGIDGKLRKLITQSFRETPYRLSCTATPSPNDYMELGTQAEFLGIMSQVEMLATYFIHDGSDTSKWRLKGHGKSRFWEWLATWAAFITTPTDLGHDGTEYQLPPLRYHNHVIDTPAIDELFVTPAQSLQERNQARRESIDARCRCAADIVNALNEPAIVWCHLNAESALLQKMIQDAVEVKGADSDQHKTAALIAFAEGNTKALVTKPKIAGFGMNLQATRFAVFVGLSDSWESFYQAIRRQWRFGQTRTVHIHIISADTEGAVVENIRRKDDLHNEMMKSMMAYMRDLIRAEIQNLDIHKTSYLADKLMELPEFLAAHRGSAT
jgi:hypothetical protein